MDSNIFLQYLRDLPIEEGRAYIREHLTEFADHQSIGEAMAEEALRLYYTPFPSLKISELLIYYGELTGHLHSHALGLKARGDALEQIGHHQAAMEASDAAGEEFLRLGEEVNWARSRISWVLSAGWLGDVEAALAAGEQARNVFLRHQKPYWVCVIDSNVALILENSGRYEEALKLYETMLTVLPIVTDQSATFVKRSLAITQLNQGVLLLRLGEFERAYLLHQQALSSFNALQEIGLVIRVEINLADLEYTQGYYGSALRRYYQVRERLTQEDESDTLLLAEVKVNMANSLMKLNRVQEACLVSEEAVEAYQKIGLSQNISRGSLLHEYATMLVASGRLKEALTALDEVWDLYKHGGFDPMAYLARLHQAEILLEMNSTGDAYNRAHLVKTYFDSRNLAAPSVRASLAMSAALLKEAQQVLLEQEGEPGRLLEEAMSICKQAMSLAHQHHLQEAVYKGHYLMGRVFALHGDLAKAVTQYRTAAMQIERILENLVYDLSPSFLRTAWSVYEEIIAIYLQQARYEQAFDYLERVRSLTLRQYLHKLKRLPTEKDTPGEMSSLAELRTQMELKDWQERYRTYSVLLAEIDPAVSPAVNREVIQLELQRCEAKLNELFERLHLQQLDAQPESLTPPSSQKRKMAKSGLFKARQIEPVQLRQHLLPGQLLLAYYLYKDRLVIFAMDSNRMITYENPGGATELERLLPVLHAYLQPHGWPDLLHPPEREIQRLLKRLYTILIAPVESLLPSSEGHLTIVPYGLLHMLPFHALFNGNHYLIDDFRVSYLPASSLLMHLADSGSDTPIAQTPPGAPLVFGYSGKGQLQRAQDEAKSIAAMLEGKCYLEQDATIARLIDEAPGSPIIHLATHGQSRLDAPNFSYVRLADGQLNAIDAFSLDLKRCELVTLSGCETGLAQSSGGDEQLGLGRAFLGVGAASMVISLWPVEDNATNELMKLFYQYLLEGESKAQALRAAQQSLLHQEASRYAHPYFWAAFRLVGDTGPLKYRATRDSSLVSITHPPKKSSLIV